MRPDDDPKDLMDGEQTTHNRDASAHALTTPEATVKLQLSDDET